MHNPGNGFTLLEMLIVVFIIGVVSAGVVIRTVSPNNAKQLNAFAVYLKSQIQLAQQQSLVQTSSFGLMIGESDYRFCQYDASGKQWGEVADRFWHATKIPKWITLHYQSDSADNKEPADTKSCVPQIVFYTSGETTPFRISIKGKNLESQLELVGGTAGSVTLLSQ